MSDLLSGTVPPDPGQQWSPPPPPAPPVRPARWPLLVTLAIALVGVAVGVVGWFRPVPHHDQPPPKPTYTAQQTADAKTRACTAFGQVDNALALAYARNGGNDPAAKLAVAAGTQIALDAGSRYLSNTLADEPAAPPDLATAVRNQANAYQKALIGFLNGLTVSDPSQQPAVNASDDATETLRRLCK